jgi:nicotinamide-nucleotide amidase
MIGEIIAIGDELISGRALNTTSSYVSKRLFESGFAIKRITSVGDDEKDIKDALEKAMISSDFIIVTGGLGPTDDDITTHTISSLFNLPLVSHPEILKKLTDLPVNPQWEMSQEMKVKLSLIPEGAANLDDNFRFAGFHFLQNNKKIYCLPGVPYELKILIEEVIKDLASFVSCKDKNLLRVFRVFGLSETEINRRLKEIIPDNLKNIIKIGFYPDFPEVIISLSSQFVEKNETSGDFEKIALSIMEILGDFIISNTGEAIEKVAGDLLKEKNMTLSLAESCTGGLIARMITTVRGSSQWFNLGVVTYSNYSKIKILDVKEDTLSQCGAVSEATVFEMLEGIKKISGSDYCISVTGVAGPDGGTVEKPVGTVFIALTTPFGSAFNKFDFKGSRHEIQTITAHTVLNWLRRCIQNGKIVSCN